MTQLAWGPPARRGKGHHLGGLAVVLAVHGVVAWALVSGLARTVIEVVKAPLQTRLIEEVKPPPPPPQKPLPLPPRRVAPPPAFVPPPEIAVAAPPAPTITATQVAPPPAPVTIAPAPAPAAPPAPPAPPPRPVGKPARIDVASCDKPDYPPAAARASAVGITKIRFTVDAAGAVSNAEIQQPSGARREHRLLDRAAVAALSQCRFTPGTDENGAPVGGFAIVDYVWRLD